MSGGQSDNKVYNLLLAKVIGTPLWYANSHYEKFEVYLLFSR